MNQLLWRLKVRSIIEFIILTHVHVCDYHLNTALPKVNVNISHLQDSPGQLLLKCQVFHTINATTVTTFRWYKNGHYLNSEEILEINSTNQYHATLMVPLEAKEAGVYNCTVDVRIPTLSIDITSFADSAVTITGIEYFDVIITN